VKSRLLILALLLVLGTPILAVTGCPECTEEGLCEDCRELYADIGRRVPAETVNVGAYVLGGLVAVAFLGVLVHVLRGGKKESALNRLRREKGSEGR